MFVAVETSEYGDFMKRAVRALGRRAAESPGDVDALVELRDLIQYADTILDDAARAVHDNGYSWTEIAAALGVTRQAARQRFNGRRPE